MLTTLQVADRIGGTVAQITRRARQRGVKPSGRVGKSLGWTEAQAAELAPWPVGRPKRARCAMCGK